MSGDYRLARIPAVTTAGSEVCAERVSSLERNDPWLSLVTVTWNNQCDLLRTWQSIVDQTNLEGVEWVVVDGGSLDGTVEWLERLAVTAVENLWHSEKDSGIYDAMNKGARMANGSFVLFLNAGDELSESDVLHRLRLMVREKRGRTIWAGDALLRFRGGHLVYRRCRGQNYIRHGMPTSHQAVLYPREIFSVLEYDLSYRIAGDYAFTAACLVRGWILARLEFPIATFQIGGTSLQNAKQLSAEARRVQREILCVSRLQRAVSQVRRAGSLLAFRIMQRDLLANWSSR